MPKHMMLEKNKRWDTLEAAQKEIEALFIDKPVEHGALVSEDGYLIVEEEDTKGSVEFSLHDLRRMANGGFFHNHPSGNSFSLDDMRIACDFNPALMSVFGINLKGIAYRYTMSRPEDGWPTSREMARLYTKAVEKAERALYRQVSKGAISISDFNLEISHEEIRVLARRIGATYNRDQV